MEESGNALQALALYEKGLQQLEQGLSITSDHPQCVGEAWDAARLHQMKMRKSREHVLSRLEALTRERGAASVPPGYSAQYEMPPSYEEACLEPSISNGSMEGVPGPSATASEKKSYFDLCSQMPMDVEPMDAYSEVPAEAREIFSISDGAQIFFVASNGSVSAPTYPTALTIYKFSPGSATPTGQHRPPAFLRIGDWVYPLHPGRMPVLHTSYGAYMLPDTNADRPGSVVGILLADDIPQEVRDMFEHLMCELTALKSEPVTADASQRRLSAKISDGIVTGAEMVSKGVVIGAEKTSEYVRIGARKLRERMNPPGSPTYVDPRVQRGMQIAKDVSDVAVRVSGFVLTQLGRATMALGQQLAPHVRRQGARLLSKAMGEENNSEKANSTMDGMMEVASGGLKGFSTVYMGLETAATILAKGIISETVQTVNYGYGPAAGQTTGTTLHTVGNMAMAVHNVSHMGVRAIAKRAAKDTGKAMVQQHENDRTGTGQSNGEIPKKPL